MQIIRSFGIAAKMYGKRTIFIAPSHDVIHAIGIVFIFLKITIPVVKADGPEGIHRHVFDCELIGARRKVRLHVKIVSLIFRQTTSFSLTANCYVKNLERSMQVGKTLLAGD